MLDTTEDKLESLFTEAAGVDNCIERVKKMSDFAFIHFKNREEALTAMDKMNGKYSQPPRSFVMMVNKIEYVSIT